MNRTDLARLILSDPPRAKREAARIVERPSISRPKAPKKTGILTRKQEKRDAKAERNQRMAEIREAVRQRHQSQCVVCGVWVPYQGECHHLLGGVGRRRVSESADTCVWICGRFTFWKCHDRATTDPTAMRRIAAYCIEHGMREAAMAVSRRLDKLEESRRSSGGGTT